MSKNKMYHQADAKVMLDDRGYDGPLVNGKNPVELIDQVLRDRITKSYYWNEQCFGLNAATLCDRAAELTYIGGTYGNGRPAPFLCLAFKLLQLTPEREIIEVFLASEFKYLKALAAFYVRLTFTSVDIYRTLEPLLSDYSKLKQRRRQDERFILTYVDQFVDDLISKKIVCGATLWKMKSRQELEEKDQLDERISPLSGEIDEIDNEAINGQEGTETGD